MVSAATPFGYHLQSQFKIPADKQEVYKLSQEQVLVTASGTQYGRLEYESELHRFLRKRLGDTAWADTVWHHYKTLLLPNLEHDVEVKAKVEEWVKLNCFNLGCSRLPLVEKMRKDLPEHFHSAWDEFITSISCKEHDHKEQQTSKKILILTNQLGEKRVSDAILGHLQKMGRDVSLIDVEQIERPSDVFLLYSGTMSEPEIHTIVNVQQNNAERAKSLWYCSSVAKKFIPDDSIAPVVKRVKELNPCLILSTRWTAPNEAAIAARLNIPMKIVHCDFGFTPHFKEGFRNASLVQFYVPSLDIANLPKDARDDEIQVLGYPIREEIKKSDDVISIKKAWNIALDDKVIFIMMGSEGSCKERLRGLITKMKTQADKLPSVQVIIVCGNNVQMRTEVQKITAETQAKSMKFKVLGWTDGQAMSDIYNMADLYIGKLGGSTTGELIYMGIPALGFAEYEPEKMNLPYLVKRGLTKELDDDNLIDQINAAFNSKMISTTPLVDWKQRLTQLI